MDSQKHKSSDLQLKASPATIDGSPYEAPSVVLVPMKLEERMSAPCKEGAVCIQNRWG